MNDNVTRCGWNGHEVKGESVQVSQHETVCAEHHGLFLAAPRERPKWLKGCPPVHGRKAGAWRGKGSFGHGFGPSLVRHK